MVVMRPSGLAPRLVDRLRALVFRGPKTYIALDGVSHPLVAATADGGPLPISAVSKSALGPAGDEGRDHSAGRRRADDRLPGGRGPRPDRPSVLKLRRQRFRWRVAVVQHEGVAVRIAEEGHVADARVDRVGRELDAAVSSSASAASMSSTCSAIAFSLTWNVIPNSSTAITAKVRLPVSNSAPGRLP